MSPLPLIRLDNPETWSNVGVDYLGPIMCKAECGGGGTNPCPNTATADVPPLGPPVAASPASHAGAATPQAAPDLASLLMNGLSNIQESMNGMETRLTGKFDSLEATVKSNKEQIVVLTDTVNKKTIDLARLEAQLCATEDSLVLGDQSRNL